MGLKEEVLALHHPTDEYSYDGDTGPHCAECTRNSNGHVITLDWPCPTALAVTGELSVIEESERRDE